ncbi:MAG: glycosyltransferase family 4 protein [Candidatus Latescibacteria bacterium]|nr:glycosyltransferase family 4 protein [Candidatus Latescibacterota bacterium]
MDLKGAWVRKLRILQFKTSASRGGAETMLLGLTSGLVDRGHEVMTVLGEKGWLEGQLAARGLPYSQLPLATWRGLVALPRMIGLIRTWRPDVVLSHGARVNAFATIAAGIAGVPSAGVEHSIDAWRTTSSFYNLIDKAVARRNAGRIAVSVAVRSMLIEKGILDGERVIVVHNGVEFPDGATALSRSDLRKQFSFPEDSLVVVTAARLAPPKGLSVLLESLATLSCRHPALRCLILGDGELRSQLEATAHDLGIEKTIVFAGAVDDVMAMLPACDLFVLPSLWEGLPVALVEAMGMGLPVVATEVGGTPELVNDGTTGLLVRPGDTAMLAAAIDRLIIDEPLRRSLAKAGRRHVRNNFGMAQVLDGYESALDRWRR